VNAVRRDLMCSILTFAFLSSETLIVINFLNFKLLSKRRTWCRSLPGENRAFLGCTWPWQRPYSRHAEHEGALTSSGYSRTRLWVDRGSLVAQAVAS
jgi:hypothetical protein